MIILVVVNVGIVFLGFDRRGDGLGGFGLVQVEGVDIYIFVGLNSILCFRG